MLFSVAPAALAGDWTKIETPWFTVMSELSERRTRAWATEFEIYRRGLAQMIPLQPSQLEPVTLVLFSSARRYSAFRPLEKGRPIKDVGGYFVSVPGRSFLAISVEGARDDVREILYHEGAHWFFTGLDWRPPLWLEEGLCQVFETFALSGESFRIGANRPLYAQYVARQKAMPFAELAKPRAAAPLFGPKHASQSQLAYVQSWAAVHDLLCTEGSDGWTRLRIFLQLGPVSDETGKNFAAVFGMDAAAMDARMQAYLRGTRLVTATFPVERSDIERGFAVTRPPTAEVDLVLGTLLTVVGRTDESEAYLRRAAVAMPTDPRPLEALAERELKMKNRDSATAHYRAAAALGARGFAGYYLMGEAGVEALVQKGGSFPLSEVRGPLKEIAENWMQAIARNPRFRPAYENVASLNALLPPDPKVDATIEEGCRRFPLSVTLRSGMSDLAERRGDWAKAYDEAIQAFILATEMPPEIQNALFDRMKAVSEKARAAGVDLAPRPGGPSASGPEDARLGDVRALAAGGRLKEALSAFEKLLGPGVGIPRSELVALLQVIGEFESIGKAERLEAAGKRPEAVTALKAVIHGTLTPEVRQRAEGLLDKWRLP
ncbi:MAG: hypothetical protein NTV51_17665 [Verrucomicrobia bacterium]|nr:hypothetical protein [Verrucomicrobiota bacterium]